jgi:hypothetical protein
MRKSRRPAVFPPRQAALNSPDAGHSQWQSPGSPGYPLSFSPDAKPAGSPRPRGLLDNHQPGQASFARASDVVAVVTTVAVARDQRLWPSREKAAREAPDQQGE